MSNITVTQEQIDKLLEEAYIQTDTRFGKCTIVTVRLKNGFILTASSACVDLKNYDEELGKNICLEHIKDRLWELEGYALQKAVNRGQKNDVIEGGGMSFGAALEAMKLGKGARLPHWKEDVVIRAQFPDKNSKMTHPYLYVESRNGLVPWRETMVELFAEDWQIVD